jgi:pyruvate kinase
VVAASSSGQFFGSVLGPVLGPVLRVSQPAPVRCRFGACRDCVRVRSTKIIATVGPASSSDDMLGRLAEAGADGFRVNCSHVSTDAVAATVAAIRRVVPHVAVLVDIQGPKLRTADATCHIGDGTAVMFTAPGVAAPAGAVVVPLSFDPAAAGVLPGHRLLVDDGRVEVMVSHIADGMVSGAAVRGGLVSPRKGVNLPDTAHGADVLTAKDVADVAAGIDAGADWVAVSFVQDACDVVAVRALAGDYAKVLAKIERPSALTNLEAIVAVSDGVMAARGDLGVELGYEQVPRQQRRIATVASRAGVLSVCATEMLESMVVASRPTRAEANDVATAVRDGFDAVMLSGETAVGVDPVAVVSAMSTILEASEFDRVPSGFADLHPDRAAVVAAAAALAARTGASTIVSLTATGYSASLLAACRPPAQVVAVTPEPAVARFLQLRWGVRAVVAPRASSFEASVSSAVEAALAAGLVRRGERVVVCASRLSPRADADTIWSHVV